MQNDATFSSPESAFYEYQIKMENKLCQVCHSLAAGFHHGAYVCEACKKFFKRYSTNELKSVVICKKNCDLEKIGRRKCSYCRYKKCLNVGMIFSRFSSTESNIDISKIPCRVCGGKSSGFHFGSLTCEGCKGFFRRAEAIKDKLECVTGKYNCIIDTTHKLSCKLCRYRRCVDVGMSKIGSRIGRQSNAVKHHCALEITNQNINIIKIPEIEYHSLGTINPDPINETFYKSVFNTIPSSLLNTEFRKCFLVFLDSSSQTFFIKALEAIDILQKPISETENICHISRTPVNPDQSLIEVWNSMMRHFDVHTRILVYFAKKIPGFNSLSLSDRRTLVQEAMYSIMLLNLAKSYEDEDDESFNYFDFSKEEYKVILFNFPQMKKILAHVMEISKVIYKLKITKTQIGLLCLIELCKNFDKLESSNVVQNMYIEINRLIWISILIELDNVSGRASVASDSTTSLMLQKLHCPSDLINHISSKVPKSLEDQWYHKLYTIFKLLGERLQEFNVEHQSIIDQLKKTRPELPYPELYTEMFQLTNF